MKTKTKAALLVAAALLTPAYAAFAQEDVDKAKNYFNTGAQAYDLGRYDLAVQAFTQAYAYAKRPAILFSIAQAERKLWTTGHDPNVLRSAVAHYKQYLSEVPEGGRRDDAVSAVQDLQPDLDRLQGPATPPAPSGSDSTVAPPPPPPTPAAPPPPKTIIAVRSDTPGATITIDGGPPKPGMAVLDNPAPGPHRVHVTAPGYFDTDTQVQAVPDQLYSVPIDLREKPALLAVQADDGADVSVDGRLVATTPLVTPVEIAPGAHYVVVTKNGKKAVSREISVTHGERVDVPVRFENSGQRVAAEVLLLGGGVTLLAGGAFTVVSLVEQSKAQNVLDAKARGNIAVGDIATYDAAVDARDRWRTASLVTYGAGLALVATGAILWFFDKPSASPPPPADTGPKPATPAPAPKRPDMEMGAAPIVGPGVWGVGAVGRF